MLEQALDTASEGASGVFHLVPLLLVILLVSLLSLHLVLPSCMPADWARLKKLPGPRPMYPFLGSIPFVPRNIKGFLPWLMDISSQYRGLFYLRLGRSVVVITTPELAEAVLSSSKEIVKGSDYDPLKPWLSEGLLTSAGSKWHSRRKALTPSFHFNILNEFIDIFNEQAGILADKIQCTNAEKIDIFPYVTRATLDIICETAMGVQIGAQDDDQSEYVKAVYRMGEIAFMRFLKPWLRIGWLYRCTNYYQDQVNSLRTLHGFTETVIRSRRSLGVATDVDTRSSYEGTRRRKLAFLDLLLSLEVDGKPLSDSDIREEVDTFMFEGHDTTSAGVNWTLYNLGRSPECQNKVYQELVDVLGHNPRAITREDLSKLKYLEMTIKESLRLFPSVPFIQRQLVDDMRIGNYDIPRGCNVTVSIYSIHRDSAHWPDPELFRPDRFSSDLAGTRHPYSYIPFSAGPRNCIGQKFALMEEKVMVATLLHRFLVRSFNKCKDLPLTADIILRLEGGLWLSFTPRQLIGS